MTIQLWKCQGRCSINLTWSTFTTIRQWNLECEYVRWKTLNKYSIKIETSSPHIFGPSVKFERWWNSMLKWEEEKCFCLKAFKGLYIFVINLKVRCKVYLQTITFQCNSSYFIAGKVLIKTCLPVIIKILIVSFFIKGWNTTIKTN